MYVGSFGGMGNPFLVEKPSGLVIIHIIYSEVNVNGVYKLFVKNIYVKQKTQMWFVFVLLFIKFTMHWNGCGHQKWVWFHEWSPSNTPFQNRACGPERIGVYVSDLEQQYSIAGKKHSPLIMLLQV